MGIWNERRADEIAWRKRKAEVAARNMQAPAGVPRGIEIGQRVRLRYGGQPWGIVVDLKSHDALVRWPYSTTWVRLDAL